MDEHQRSWLVAAADLGQSAWLFGNLYEGVVGVPQLLADARPARAAGLLSPGSPVRYFAPAAPLAVGATAATLLRSWRTDVDRPLTVATSAAFGTAIALSGFLIWTVNRTLLGDEPLSDARRAELVTRWHRTNIVRVGALAVGRVGFAAITRRDRTQSLCTYTRHRPGAARAVGAG